MRLPDLKGLPLFLSVLLLAMLVWEGAGAVETALRGKCWNCNTGLGFHGERFCYGPQGAGQVCDLNDGMTFQLYTQQEIDQKLVALENKFEGRVQAQQKSLNEISGELLKRIGELPIEFAKDENAYKLLKDRLKKDLSEVFEEKKSE